METELSTIASVANTVSIVAILLYIIYRDDRRHTDAIEHYRSVVSRFIDNLLNKP